MATNGHTEEKTVHYEPPRKRRQESKKMQPPLTPMIDVTFQLLLFFLLTFTFREEEGQIRGALPKKGSGGVAEKEKLKQPIRIHILPSNNRKDAIFEVEGVHEQITNGEQLYQFLLQRKQALQSAEGPIIIRPDAYVRWQHVVEVFNQAVRAKFLNIGFAPVS